MSRLGRVMRGWQLLALGCVMACGGCALHIDQDTVVRAGGVHKSIYAVDGNIRVEPQARAASLSTVDGKVSLGAGASAVALRTVDGDIGMAEGAFCSGNVQSVDGKVSLAPRSQVDGMVRTVTGDIEARDAAIGGRLETVSGRIVLRGATHVGEGILLEKPDSTTTVNDHEERRTPVVVIGPGVVVDGAIRARRDGVLKVSRQARIGAVEGLEVHWFDGEPPAGTLAATK